MIRENRRPLLAFALVAVVCAATLVQGVRSEALQGFVAAQVPQLVVSGAQLVPADEADPAPAALPQEELPAVPAPEEPAPVVVEEAPTASPRGDTDATDPEPEAAVAQRGHARPPGHAQSLTRPDRAQGQRSHTGGPQHRADPPAGHQRRTEARDENKARGDARRSDRGRHHRHPARGHDRPHGKGAGKGNDQD